MEFKMQRDSVKNKLKKELKSLFKSMDFVSNNFLNKGNINRRNFQIYFNIYQQLGIAWEFLGLQCKHWDGYKKVRDKKEVCKICGKVKDVGGFYYLIYKEGHKKIGRKLRPNSKQTFSNKQQAKILNDTINFHGALLNVDVHNSYKSNLLKAKHKIGIAAGRIVSLKERGIKCHIDQHLIDVELNNAGKKSAKRNMAVSPGR